MRSRSAQTSRPAGSWASRAARVCHSSRHAILSVFHSQEIERERERKETTRTAAATGPVPFSTANYFQVERRVRSSLRPIRRLCSVARLLAVGPAHIETDAFYCLSKKPDRMKPFRSITRTNSINRVKPHVCAKLRFCSSRHVCSYKHRREEKKNVNKYGGREKPGVFAS